MELGRQEIFFRKGVDYGIEKTKVLLRKAFNYEEKPQDPVKRSI